MKNKNFFKINLIYFVAITLVAIIFVLGYLGILQNEILTSFLIQIVVMFAIPMLMYSLLTKKRLKETLTDAGLKKVTTNTIIISIGLGFTLYFINTFVADTFSSIIAMFGYENISSGTSQTTVTYGTLLKELILSCVLPGFCEEFLHRGIMLHANKKYSNPKFCLIISSLLFGLVHLNIRQFFYAAILGFLMGYTTLVADSIIPSIIAHFMNNFLSTYFFYGSQFKWPLASFVAEIREYFYGNIMIFMISSTLCVVLLFLAYIKLTKLLQKERLKKEIHLIIKETQMEKLTMEEAQIKFEEINQLLKLNALNQNNQNKSTFFDKIFLISSIVLGVLITISSFIWGVI